MRIKGNLGKLRRNRHMPLSEQSCMNKTVTDIPHVDRETQYSIYDIMSIIWKMDSDLSLNKNHTYRNSLTLYNSTLKVQTKNDQLWLVYQMVYVHCPYHCKKIFS